MTKDLTREERIDIAQRLNLPETEKIITAIYRSEPICIDCAVSHKGQWPRNHIATCRVTNCAICGVLKSTTPTSDFKWPWFNGKQDKLRLVGD